MSRRKYWLWSCTQENWEVLKKNLIWATYDKKVTTMVKKGDVLIFYVKGTLSFKGIFEVASDWYKSKKKIWSDELKERRKKYPYQIDLKIIQLGEANYKKLVPKLKFVEKKQYPQVYIYGTGGGPVNFRKPIDESDYRLILNEMQRTHPPKVKLKRFTHRELTDMLIELGKLFGKYPEKEYKSVPYVYDVVWKEVRIGNPTKVFEIQHKGVLDSALAKLKHAYDIWHADLFLVITRHKDKEKAKLLLQGTFHGIESITTIIQPEEIEEMYAFKKKFSELERRLQ